MLQVRNDSERYQLRHLSPKPKILLPDPRAILYLKGSLQGSGEEDKTDKDLNMLLARGALHCPGQSFHQFQVVVPVLDKRCRSLLPGEKEYCCAAKHSAKGCERHHQDIEKARSEVKSPRA